MASKTGIPYSQAQMKVKDLTYNMTYKFVLDLVEFITLG